MTLEEFNILKAEHPAVMLYFFNDVCGVCHALKPRVENMLMEEFPKVRFVPVDAGESMELAGQLRMLSVPGILLFLEGKEYLRYNGMVALQELESKIFRPYHLMFD